MKDRLLYLTIGLLIGIVVMQWTTNKDLQASIVVPGTGIVAMSNNNQAFLDENGQVWNAIGEYNAGNDSWICWVREPYYDPPIPTAQIKFWTHTRFITMDNIFWTFAQGPDGEMGWHNCGPWPGTVPTNQSTWGEIKGEYKGENQ